MDWWESENWRSVSGEENDHSIKNNNIHVGQNKDKILIILYSSKTHDQSSYPQQIKISSQKEEAKHIRRQNKKCKHSFFCPFEVVRNYIGNRRGHNNPPDQNFFIFSDGSPVTPTQVRNLLKQTISNFNLDSSLYSCHSLRAGRASDMLKSGVPIEKIRRLGRWRSNAVYKYLRY